MMTEQKQNRQRQPSPKETPACRPRIVPQNQNSRPPRSKDGSAGCTLAELRRVEEALRRSEDRFRLLAENIVDVIWMMDLNLRYTYVSPSVIKLRGWSVKDAMAQTMDETLEPSSQKMAKRVLAEELARERQGTPSHRVHTMELELNCKDGSTIWTEVKMTFLYNDKEEPIGVMGVTRDIAERRRTEEVLRESEERFRALSAAAQDAIIMMDNDGCITFWSEAAERIFGHTTKDAVGQRVHDLLASSGYRAKFAEAFPRWRQTGQGDVVGKVFGLAALRKDGTEFPAEISLSSTQIKGRWNAVAIIRDITERTRAEEELELRNILLSTEQNTSLDGILVVDEKAQIQSYNQRFVDMWGVPAEVIATKSDELAMKSILDRLPDPQKFLEKISRLYEHRREESRDEIVLKDGRVFDRYSAPMYGSDEKYYGRVWYFRDITVRVRAQEEVRNANEKLSALVKKLEKNSIQTGLLSELREFLQGCPTTEEIGPVVARSMKKIFPDSEGALFLLSPSRTDLESVVRWGGFPENADDNVFAPDACWGLRRGGVYVVDNIETGLLCQHLKHRPAAGYACLPLMARGDVLGLLHIRKQPAGEEGDDASMISGLKDISLALTELLSLSISNIKLQETLSGQSIKDPLTGLFNRRYMEENFQREICRAARKQEQIGVLMVDIDHFKTFNDLHGHPAGDAALIELANFFKSKIRGADIVCRYGGEEFTLILPECSLENAGKRAHELVGEAKTLRVQYNGRVIGPIALSIGGAVYPEHGTSPEDLLRAADAALYRAKQDGRDRVVLA